MTAPTRIILLPGLDGTGLLFQPLIDALPPTLAPIVISYPGDRVLTYDELLPIVVEQLPRDEPYILLAESFSGPLAVTLAATRPHGLVGLVLCATFVSPPWKHVVPIVQLIARPLVFRFFLTFKRLRALLSGRLTNELRNSLAKMESMVRPHVVAARVRYVFRVDVRDALKRIDVPILYLRGTRDRLVPKHHSISMQQLLPDMRIQEIESSHLVLQREPMAAARAIEDFAERSCANT